MAVTKYKAADGWHVVTGVSETVTGSTDPTTSTQGYVGQFYLNRTTGNVFICRVATQGSYAWVQVGYADLSNKEDVANKSDIYTSDTRYVWEKWSTNSTQSYHKADIGIYTYGAGNDMEVYVLSGEPIIKDNGKFDTSSASVEVLKDYYLKYYSQPNALLTTHYTEESDEYAHVDMITPSAGASFTIQYTKYIVITDTIYTKGNIRYNNVISTSSSSYPQNGAQDGYWYVYVGTLDPQVTYASTKALIDGLATKDNVSNKSNAYTAQSGIDPQVTYSSTKALIDGLATKDNKGYITAGSTTYVIDKPVKTDPGTGTAGHIIIVTN